MSRPRGGYIGHSAAPAAGAINSAASGIWTLREAEALKRAGTWPFVGTSLPVTSGLQLWLDASDASTLFDATSGGSLVAADGDVARWEDKSGNGRHATQGTAANRPLRKTAIQGGRDVLRFDGSNDLMSLSSTIVIPSSFTCFSVLERKRTFPGDLGLTRTMPFGDGRSGQGSAYPGGYWVGDVTYHRSNTDSNFYTTHGSADTRTGYFLMDTRRNETTAVDLRLNGTSKGIVTTGNGITLNVSGQITTIAFKDDPTYHDGDLCELIIYNSALSDADRSAVESYLMSKWGIA